MITRNKTKKLKQYKPEEKKFYKKKSYNSINKYDIMNLCTDFPEFNKSFYKIERWKHPILNKFYNYILSNSKYSNVNLTTLYFTLYLYQDRVCISEGTVNDLTIRIDTTKDFSHIPVSIQYKYSAHAISLFIDNKTNCIYVYEPTGYVSKDFENLKIKKYIKILLSRYYNLKYYKIYFPIDWLYHPKYQKFEVSKFDNYSGFCMILCIRFLHLKILYPELTWTELSYIGLDRKLGLAEEIRAYATWLIEL